MQTEYGVKPMERKFSSIWESDNMWKKADFFKRPEPVQNKKWEELLRRNDYPESSIASAASKLENLTEDFAEAVLEWDRTGELPYMEVEGFTADEIVEYMGVHEIAAILMLDWLRREPEEAKMAIAESVSKIEISENEKEIIRQMEEQDEDL